MKVNWEYLIDLLRSLLLELNLLEGTYFALQVWPTYLKVNIKEMSFNVKRSLVRKGPLINLE